MKNKPRYWYMMLVQKRSRSRPPHRKPPIEIPPREQILLIEIEDQHEAERLVEELEGWAHDPN